MNGSTLVPRQEMSDLDWLAISLEQIAAIHSEISRDT